MSTKVKLKRQSTSAAKAANKGNASKNLKTLLLLPGILIALVLGYIYFDQSTPTAETYAELEGNLQIVKSEITADARFFPFKLDGVDMEVLALRADDGTIRTALNTCQICYSSGRGYYIQEPNTKKLVCQNCGNKFAPENVEVIRGGCNPIPITGEAKTDDGTNITIARCFLEESKSLFVRWSKS